MNLRVATPEDIPALRELIDASARALSVGFYSPAQINAAVTHVFGVDTQLIDDGTYFVIEAPDGPAAVGGWSARRTLYGGDQMKAATDPLLDPATDAARIRAFFVHPNWARQGLARRLYAACAEAAWAAGFREFELMATRPGEPLYKALGFEVVEQVLVTLPGGVDVPFARMRRAIENPLAGRTPTSHERMSGRPWDASYRDGEPPWDIGRPQPAIVRLTAERRLAEPVLDAGCGTGENALHVASLGIAVFGFDVSETAVAIARTKAVERGVDVEFAVADALRLERLGRTFATVLDCGLFHTFDENERVQYAMSLASVAEHHGTLYVLCFSDEGEDQGPHPISQAELRAAFSADHGWNVVDIESERVQTRFHDDGAPAWLATITRVRASRGGKDD